MTWFTHQVAVAQVAISLLSNSDDRTSYQITTPATNVITIGPTAAVTTANGFTLPVTSTTLFAKNDNQDVHMAVWAISAAGTNTVTVREDISPDG